MPESAKTADQTKEPQTLKKSLLAEVVAQELGTTSNALENKKPTIPSFSWDFGKKKAEIKETTANGKEASVKNDSAGEGFIFGSRLADKVTNADASAGDNKPKDASSIFKQYASSTPGGSFFSAKSSSKDSFLKPFGDASQIKSTFNSTTSASEPEQAIETITGEEGEKNLLHISCKFYIYDRETKSWLERGLGTLRINEKLDSNHDYRIVGRATGNQRVCINSKIFPEMLLEKVSDKRLKMSALSPDSDVPQLFVVHGTPSAVASVQHQLEQLVSKVKQNANRKRPLDTESRNDESHSVPAKNATKKTEDQSDSESDTREESSKNDDDENEDSSDQ